MFIFNFAPNKSIFLVAGQKKVGNYCIKWTSIVKNNKLIVDIIRTFHS